MRWFLFLVNLIFLVVIFFRDLSFGDTYGFYYKSNFSSIVNKESYNVVRVLLDSGYIGNRLDFRGKNVSLRYSLRNYPSIYQGSNSLFNFLSIGYEGSFLVYYYQDYRYRINFDDLKDIVVLSDDFIEYKNRKYRGVIKVIFRGGRYYVVNYVDMEDYLRSVVPCEMPYTWNLEALKAQAIAARTYTLKMMLNRRSKGEFFDLYSTVLDQAYYGVDFEKDTTDLAVESTKGMVLVYNDDLIWALYHSNCGGYTIDGYLAFANRISSKESYLSSVKCIYGGNSWVSEVSLYEIKNLLKKYIKREVYSINSISVNFLKTTFIYKTENNTFANYSIYNWDLRKGLNYKIKSPFIDKVKIVGDVVIFEGRGSGHGVGMCQYGANLMAKEGYNCFEILKHYYPNTKIIDISSYFEKK